MEINQGALLAVLRDMTEILEQCVEDMECLYGALSFDEQMRNRYAVHERRPDAAQRLTAIHGLRRRLDSISHDLQQLSPR
jgi:hypothetical protein